MIDTGVNGFLAEPQNALDFAQCIQRALDSHSYTALCRNARIKALTAYSEKRWLKATSKFTKINKWTGVPDGMPHACI